MLIFGTVAFVCISRDNPAQLEFGCHGTDVAEAPRSSGEGPLRLNQPISSNPVLTCPSMVSDIIALLAGL